MTAPTTKGAAKSASKTEGFAPLDSILPNDADTPMGSEKRASYWIGCMPPREIERETVENGRTRKWVENIPAAPCQIILGDHDFPAHEYPIVRRAKGGQEQQRTMTVGKVVELTESQVDKILADGKRSRVRWRKRKGEKDDHGYIIKMPGEAEIAQGKAEAAARKEAYTPPPIHVRKGDEPVWKYVFMTRVAEGHQPVGTPPATVEEAGGIQRP